MTILSKANRYLRDTLPADLQRYAAFREARRRMLSSGGMTDNERQLLGSEPSSLTEGERRTLSRISIRVHAADDMYRPGSPGQYLVAGLSAVRCIQQALVASGRTAPVRRLLDLPCGYGRVLRFLKVEFPEAKITACDLDPHALSFCRRVFDVDSVVSRTDLAAVPLAHRYDLIWCGSLITHIDDRAAVGLLSLLSHHLTERGVCIFTTHGQRSVDWIRNGTEAFGLTAEGLSALLRGFDDHGYGYADYPVRPGYGISVVSHARMVEMAAAVGKWREAACLQHAWGNHHDVYAFAMGMPGTSAA